MSNLFKNITNIEVALDVAISLEQYGRDFYKNQYENTNDPELKTLLSSLAAEEEKHLGLYRDLFDKVNKSDTLQQITLPGEYGAYIDLLTSEITSILNNNINNTINLINLSLDFEKNTLLIFNEIKDLFKDDPNQSVIIKICNEEKKHIKKILAYKEKI